MANELIPARDVAKRFIAGARESIDKLPMEQVRGIAALGDKPMELRGGMQSGVIMCAILAARDRVREFDGGVDHGGGFWAGEGSA